MYITPEKRKEMYQHLREIEEEDDWLYEPEVAKEILARGNEVKKEMKNGELLSLEEVWSDLGV